MAEKRSGSDENTSDREIVISRVFDAPREVVWNAWTDAKQVAQWWGPRGFTTTIDEMDVRPGGSWRLTMHGPDGKDYPNRSVFIEVVKPGRIVYSHGGGRKGEPGAQFEATWTFEAHGDKTKLTLRMVFPSAAERDLVVKTYNAIEGGNQTLDRLGEQLAKMSGAGRETVITRNFTRIFDARREVVWNAWTDPKQVAQWWGPHGFTNPVCEVDARVGGAILIHMRGPDGAVHKMTGVFEEVVRPERLVFKSEVPDKDGVPFFEQRTILTFAELGGKTKLTVEVNVFKSRPEAAPMLGGMDVGWNQMLERLSEYVTRA